MKSRRLLHCKRLSSIIAECISFAALTAQNGFKIATQNRKILRCRFWKVQLSIEMPRNCKWSCDAYPSLIATFQAIIADLEVSSASFASLRQIALWLVEGEKTFNLRSTTMDLFGFIFIKVAAAIPKLQACIGNKINGQGNQKEMIFCSRFHKNF